MACCARLGASSCSPSLAGDHRPHGEGNGHGDPRRVGRRDEVIQPLPGHLRLAREELGPGQMAEPPAAHAHRREEGELLPEGADGLGPVAAAVRGEAAGARGEVQLRGAELAGDRIQLLAGRRSPRRSRRAATGSAPGRSGSGTGRRRHPPPAAGAGPRSAAGSPRPGCSPASPGRRGPLGRCLRRGARRTAWPPRCPGAAPHARPGGRPGSWSRPARARPARTPGPAGRRSPRPARWPRAR